MTQRAVRDTVSINHVASRAKRRFMTHHSHLANSEEQTFLSDMLRALPLMLKSTTWIRDVHQVIDELQGQDSSMSILEKVSEVIHSAKTVTSRWCWSQHIEPLRSKYKQLEELHAKLKQQFTGVRTDYLREIALLREQAREREDPEKGLEGAGGDIVCFYDPTTSLGDEEMTFVNQVVSEKLKMILEQNPHVQGNLSKAQIEEMMSRGENSKSQLLQRMLERKERENEELKQCLQELRSHDPMSGISSAMSAAQKVGMLEDTIECLRCQLMEQEHREREKDNLRQEALELRRAYEDELEGRVQAQQRARRLEEQLRDAGLAKQAVQDEHAEASSKLEAMGDNIAALKDQVARQQKALKAASSRASGNASVRQTRRMPSMRVPMQLSVATMDGEDMTGVQVGGEPEQKESPATSRSRSKSSRPEDTPEPTEEVAPEALEPRDPDLVHALAMAEERSTRLCQERDALAAEKAELSRRCRELREELTAKELAHADEYTKAMAEETDHLCEISEAVKLLARDSPSAAGPQSRASSDLEAASDPTSLAYRERQLQLLRESVADLSWELNSLTMECTPPEEAHRVEELRNAVRQQEFQLFLAEVAFEAARWDETAEGAGAWEREQSVRALFQKVVSHCNRLTEKLALSACLTLHLTEAMTELSAQTSSTVAAIKKSPALEADPSLEVELRRLEEVGEYDALAAARRAISDGGEGSDEHPSSRAAAFAKRAKRLQERIEEALRKFLPVVRFAQDAAEQAGAQPQSPLALRGIAASRLGGPLTPPRSMPSATSASPERTEDARDSDQPSADDGWPGRHSPRGRLAPPTSRPSTRGQPAGRGCVGLPAVGGAKPGEELGRLQVPSKTAGALRRTGTLAQGPVKRSSTEQASPCMSPDFEVKPTLRVLSPPLASPLSSGESWRPSSSPDAGGLGRMPRVEQAGSRRGSWKASRMP